MPTRSAVLTVTMLAAAAACSSDTNAPVTHHIAGGWLFREHLAAASLSRTCDDTARVGLVQQSATFSVAGPETGQCVTGVDTTRVFDVVDANDGRIGRDSTVLFSTADCRYSGTITSADGAMSGTAQCNSTTAAETGTWRMTRSDILPPTVSALAPSGGITQGDTMVIVVNATDSALAWVGDSVFYDAVNYVVDCPQHIAPVVDSVPVSGTNAQRILLAPVPWCAWYAHVTAFAVDTAGNRAEDAHGPFLIDFPETQLSGTLDDTVYTLGDTVRISITATNPHRLSFVGYRWSFGNPAGQDSVAVTGTSATHTFALALPPSGPYAQLYVTLFARHVLGWLSQSQNLLLARLTDAARLPLERLTLPAAPNDIAYARGADQVFLTDRSAPVIHAVGLSPLGLGSTYTIGAVGESLDLSESEDSVLVALPTSPATVSVVRISTGSVASDSFPSPIPGDLFDARWVRVVGNGQAMVLAGDGSAGYVLQLDLATGTVRQRVPWSGYSSSTRSANRSRLLLFDGGSPVGTELYIAATDSFLPEQRGVVSLPGTISGDDSATAWLIGCQLLSGDMTLLKTFSDPTIGFGPSALSTDGARAYCGRLDGVVEFDAATGNRLRAIWLPSQPDKLLALPGNRLLAVSGSEMFVLKVP